MFEATVFVSAESELSEEYQVSLLLIHEEEVPQEGTWVEAVLSQPPDLKSCVYLVCPEFSLATESLLIDKFSFIIDSIELQLMRRMQGPLDDLFNLIVSSRVVENSIFIKKSLCLALFLHDRMKSDQREVCLRKIFRVTNLSLLAAERAAYH